MSGALMNKVWDLFGMDSAQPEEEEENVYGYDEELDEICSFLKERKSVIVNLEYVNKEVARRIVDFISGGVYALDGYIQKVSNSIFLVAPSNYEITNEMAREEMKNKLSVSWLKNNGIN